VVTAGDIICKNNFHNLIIVFYFHAKAEPERERERESVVDKIVHQWQPSLMACVRASEQHFE